MQKIYRVDLKLKHNVYNLQKISKFILSYVLDSSVQSNSTTNQVLKEQNKTTATCVIEKLKAIPITSSEETTALLISNSDPEEELYRNILLKVKKKRAENYTRAIKSYQLNASMETTAQTAKNLVEAKTPELEKISSEDSLKVIKTPPLEPKTKESEKTFPNIDDLLISKTVLKELNLPFLNFSISK